MLSSSMVLKHKCTSYYILHAFALLVKAFHPASPQGTTQEAMERWIRSLSGSERNSIYQNIFLDQYSTNGLEIRQLQGSRGKLYGLRHSYAITSLQPLISGWGRVGEKWVANFSMPRLSSSLKGTLFRICLFLIEKKAFCIIFSAFL